MDEGLLSIGALSDASGLGVSALRFYDKADVLVPAAVDPDTGYRRYHPTQVRTARLVAGLRRIGMPVAEIRVAVEQLSDTGTVEELLGAHLRRLEHGLADARREVERLRQLLGPGHAPTSAALRASDLGRALDTVRHAVGSDPEFPALAGVLVELSEDACRLVATDRYRLTVAVAATLPGADPPPVSETPRAPHPVRAALVPVDFVDRVRDLLGTATTELRDDRTTDRIGVAARPADTVHSTAPPDEVTLVLSSEQVELRRGEQRLACAPLDLEFPDYRRLLPSDDLVPHASLDLTTAQGDLAAAPASRHTEHVVIGRRGEELRLVEEPDPDEPVVAVDREFLLQAADALGPGQLHLDLDGPIAPLVIRSADERALSLLMPVRREE